MLLCYFGLIEQMGNPEPMGVQSQIRKYVRFTEWLAACWVCVHHRLAVNRLGVLNRGFLWKFVKDGAHVVPNVEPVYQKFSGFSHPIIQHIYFLIPPRVCMTSSLYPCISPTLPITVPIFQQYLQSTRVICGFLEKR